MTETIAQNPTTIMKQIFDIANDASWRSPQWDSTPTDQLFEGNPAIIASLDAEATRQIFEVAHQDSYSDEQTGNLYLAARMLAVPKIVQKLESKEISQALITFNTRFSVPYLRAVSLPTLNNPVLHQKMTLEEKFDITHNAFGWDKPEVAQALFERDEALIALSLRGIGQYHHHKIGSEFTWGVVHGRSRTVDSILKTPRFADALATYFLEHTNLSFMMRMAVNYERSPSKVVDGQVFELVKLIHQKQPAAFDQYCQNGGGHLMQQLAKRCDDEEFAKQIVLPPPKEVLKRGVLAFLGVGRRRA